MRWYATGFNFAEDLTEVMIYSTSGMWVKMDMLGLSTEVDATVNHGKCKQVWKQYSDHLVLLGPAVKSEDHDGACRGILGLLGGLWCYNCYVGMLSHMMLWWSMKLPVGLESISNEKTETDPACFIWTFNGNGSLREELGMWVSSQPDGMQWFSWSKRNMR